MKAAAASRVFSITSWANLMYPNTFLSYLKHGLNTPEWHRAEAERLEFERDTKAKIAEAKKLRREDADYSGMMLFYTHYPHEFMAGPSGRLPK